MREVVLIKPHIHKTELPFQLHLYEVWKNSGIRHKKSICPTWRWLFHIVNHFSFPKLFESNKEAHIVLVGGGPIKWGGWPDCMFYEVIPFIWDCWPIYYDRVFKFISKYKVKTVITTSSQTAKVLGEIFPSLNILNITEGIDPSLYDGGRDLNKRKIDILEYGRSNPNVGNLEFDGNKYRHIKSNNGERLFKTEKELTDALSDTKVTIAYPRCVTDPITAGNVETLTQRYWENMLSRIVMVGRAPSELINLVGYNPVINLNEEDAEKQINDILENINDYQELVDKNRDIALHYSSWADRVKIIEEYLASKGYLI